MHQFCTATTFRVTSRGSRQCSRDHSAYAVARDFSPYEMLESPWEELLHYGLLVGAIIQLVAIASIVLLPSRPDEEEEEEVGAGKKREGAEEKRKPVSTVSSRKGKKEKGARRRR